MYPVNVLREELLQTINTPLFFAVDGDFVPSLGLYSSIVKQQEMYLKLSDYAVFVVPAFKSPNQKGNER